MTPEIHAGLLKRNVPVGRLTKATILKTICIELEMDFEEVKNKKTRKKEYVYARHLYGYFCRIFTNESYSSIAMFIKKDHATIIHSNRTINNWIDTDKNVESLCKLLKANFNSKIINFTENKRDKISAKIILQYEN